MTRLLRIELRRNASVALLPVVALLWLVSPITRHLAPIALWTDRSADIQSSILALAPFTAGVGAWTAYRERRRGAVDLLATTPRNAAARCLTALAATVLWAVLGYVAGAVAMLAITSGQATWGHPVLLPLLDGLLAVVAAAALGFALGRLLPGRFTAPLVAIGLLGLLALGVQTTFDGSFLGALSPAYPSINLAVSVFYPIRTDLVILQIALAIGVLCAAIGVTVGHTGGRRVGVSVATAGVVLVGAAFGLLGTGHRDAQGAIVVPALDSVAVQQPLPFTPVCGGGAVSVCVHPAYAAKLSALDTAVNRLAAPLVGTPGLPVRVQEGPINRIRDVTVRGRPPVLVIPPVFIQQGDSLGFETTAVNDIIAISLVDAPGQPPAHAGATQRAVALFLVRQCGIDADPVLLPADPAVRAAADRLAALSPGARHAWFAAHIDDVRANTISLGELP